MRSCCIVLCWLCLTPVEELQAEARVVRSIPYVAGGGASRQQTLDVYAPQDAAGLPVVVWIHGGAWRIGDKSRVEQKPAALNAAGYVMVSINYRLHPAADYAGQAADVAQAVRWVHEHAAEYGGSPERIVLMGHSAGAHLAALVSTDARYLQDAGLDLSALSGAILLDGAAYDIPQQLQLARLPRLRETYLTVFGVDEQRQQDASPITHVAMDKGIPPFLILFVASRRDGRIQSEAFGAALRDAGGSAQVIAAEGKTHATINQEIGLAGDEPTRLILEFLRETTQRGDAAPSAGVPAQK